MSAPLRGAAVIPRLPNCRDPSEGDAIPADLVGARILAFGTVAKEFDVEGGGLVIDYVPKGKRKQNRIVLAFTELGMWMVKGN